MRVQLTELGAMQSIAHLDSHDPLPLPSSIAAAGGVDVGRPGDTPGGAGPTASFAAPGIN